MTAIFFVERTGRKFFHRGAYCERCKRSTFVQARAMTIPKRATYIDCEECGDDVRICSAGTDYQYVRPDTGQLYIDTGFKGRPYPWLPHPTLPIGAVWAMVKWDRRDHLSNWISYVDEKGKPLPENRVRFLERLHPDDGRVLVCRLPDGHDWVIDSRCNNCTHKHDDVHWCWNRSGRPEDRTLDVRKGKPGQTTCDAGAGSIQTGSWHGFLHNGELVTC